MTEDLVDDDPNFPSTIAEPNHIEEPVHDEVPEFVQEDEPISSEHDITKNNNQQEVPKFILRRSDRMVKPSTRYSSNKYVLLIEAGDPDTFEEDMEDDHKKEWMDAMQDELNSMHENQTFDLVCLPKGKKALKNRWVFRVKQDESTSSLKYKARLVVKGYSQKQGVDFDEIFSPVVKMSSIRVVLGLAARLNLEIEQMDVKTAFLHGDLEEELYMEQPEGYRVKGKEHCVWRLKKSLYGLKQAPHQWYKKFESFMAKHTFARTTSDHCVFVKHFSKDDFILLLLYVDDMLIVGQNV